MVFTDVLEGLQLGVAVISVATGRIAYANERFRQLTGYDQGVLAATHFLDLLVPENRAEAHAEWERLTRGEAQRLRAERRLMRADGTALIVRLYVRSVTWEGEAHGLWEVQELASAPDADALDPSELKYRSFFENLREMVVLHEPVMDERGDIVDWVCCDANPGALRELGITAEQLRGRRAAEVFGDKLVAQTQDIARRVFLTGESVRFDGHRRGRNYHVSVFKCGPLVATSALDITDRRRAEQALQEADRRKDEFLAMLAHELRNPLAAISNAAAIMRQLPIADLRLAGARDIVERQTGHLARMVDELLDASRIQRGKITLRKQRVEVAEAIAQATHAVAGLVAARQLRLGVVLPSVPLAVQADEVRLVQAVTNLLGNAAKFTPPGGQVELRAFEERGEAVIEVHDNGMGIAASLLPHVFDLFTQAERGADRGEGGLGIGLAIVKGLIELHGGRVELESEEGRGTTARIRMAAQVGAAASAPESAASPSGPGLRVLVVDDNRDAVESLALLLELAGHTVHKALTPERALELARETRPEAILLDIGLPGMDGCEVARRLRTLPEFVAVPIIAVSGYEAPDSGRDSAFSHHLVKPVDVNSLLDLLKRGRRASDKRA